MEQFGRHILLGPLNSRRTLQHRSLTEGSVEKTTAPETLINYQPLVVEEKTYYSIHFKEHDHSFHCLLLSKNEEQT